MRLPRRDQAPFTVQMTPMIDIVFQLLIFFVCTVEFQRSEEVLEANLPPLQGPGIASKSSEELDLGRIDVAIHSDKVSIRFQGRTRSFPTIEKDSWLALLRRQLEVWCRIDAKIPVRIACQAEVPTGVPLQVYDLCLQVGFKDVGLLHLP
jgi:biopolymer transport protein ExbD